MTTKEELQKQFDEWVDQGKQLKKQIDALPDDKYKPSGRWKPGGEEKYWSINMKGIIADDTWRGTSVDNRAYALANVYNKNKNAELPLYPEQKPPKALFLMMGVIIVGMGLAIGWFWL